MTELSRPERALRAIVFELTKSHRAFALVGGLAVSIRAEVRFTRDVDLAVVVRDDADAEALVRELSAVGYRALVVVEHEIVLEQAEGIGAAKSRGDAQKVCAETDELDQPRINRTTKSDDRLRNKLRDIQSYDDSIGEFGDGDE